MTCNRRKVSPTAVVVSLPLPSPRRLPLPSRLCSASIHVFRVCRMARPTRRLSAVHGLILPKGGRQDNLWPVSSARISPKRTIHTLSKIMSLPPILLPSRHWLLQTNNTAAADEHSSLAMSGGHPVTPLAAVGRSTCRAPHVQPRSGEPRRARCLGAPLHARRASRVA